MYPRLRPSCRQTTKSVSSFSVGKVSVGTSGRIAGGMESKSPTTSCGVSPNCRARAQPPSAQIRKSPGCGAIHGSSSPAYSGVRMMQRGIAVLLALMMVFIAPSSLREAKNPLQYNKKAGDKQYPTCLLLRGEIRNSAITPARALLPRPRELPRPSPRRRRRIRLRRPDGWTGRCASSRCQRSAPSRGQSDLPARRQ